MQRRKLHTRNPHSLFVAIGDPFISRSSKKDFHLEKTLQHASKEQDFAVPLSDRLRHKPNEETQEPLDAQTEREFAKLQAGSSRHQASIDERDAECTEQEHQNKIMKKILHAQVLDDGTEKISSHQFEELRAKNKHTKTKNLKGYTQPHYNIKQMKDLYMSQVRKKNIALENQDTMGIMPAQLYTTTSAPQATQPQSKLGQKRRKSHSDSDSESVMSPVPRFHNASPEFGR